MTYSIVARDPRTGELGIAVQSRFFAAGWRVPWIEAGVGVIASQSFMNPVYGSEGMPLLRAGLAPRDALDRLVSEDAEAAIRQVAMLDMRGRSAVHTGASCVAAAGHAIGAHCSAQANMMAQAGVWQAMVAAFERARGDLPERLLQAMQAAEREGGDLRGRQAAALIVVAGEPGTASKDDRVVDLRIDDHPDPVGEIERQLSYARAHQGAARARDKVLAGDLQGALAELDACVAAWPDEPEFLTRRALVLLVLGRIGDAREALARACAIHPGWAQFVLRLAEAGIAPIPRETLESLVAGLSRGGRSSP